MNGDAGTRPDPMPFERAREVDAWCDRFEADWRAGRRVRVEDYLAAAPATIRADLRPELLALEAALRREVGVRTEPEVTQACPPDAPRRLDLHAGGLLGPGATTLTSRSDEDRETLVNELATRLGLLGREDATRPAMGMAGPGEDLLARQRTALERLADALLGRPGDGDQTIAFVTSRCPAPGAVVTDGRVGPRFQILRPHARGGLGEVFLARDGPLRREVALKELQHRHAHQPDCRARFLREAELTGSLEHPGIVPVYDLGEHEDGRPYYAMRFIRGESLQDASDRLHDPAVKPGDRRNLARVLRPLLRRFVDVCNAVSYAHSRGIIHRDLKPANIMLGPFGEALVVDWGLAKVLATPDGAAPAGRDGGTADGPASPSGTGTETSPGEALGTPRYMSPEQAAGQVERIGPASDVYGLGATLYHLLTGRAPFEGPHLHSILDRVRRGEFPPPRRIDPAVPPALESICLKAMALDPGARYPTARALAEDVERWLDDEAVTAHRDGVAARLARWGRRHRPAVVGGGALLATATLALAIGTVLIGRESAHREAQRLLAIRNFGMARDAVDRMLTHVGEVELAEVPQMQAVRRQLLEETLPFYEAFLLQRQDDPALRHELGRALIRLARVQELLGDVPAALRTWRRAVATLGTLAGPSGRSAARLDLARARDGLGMLLKRANRFREAEAELRAALALSAGLARRAPGDPENRRVLGETGYHLGTLLARVRSRGAEDERLYREALRIRIELVAGARDRPELRADLARSLNNLGLLLADDGRTAEAEAAFREADDLGAALTRESPGVAGYRWQRARAASNLGVLRRAAGDFDGARAGLQRARTLLEALAADFPDVPDYRRDLASVWNNLGLLDTDRGDRGAAEGAFRESLRLREALVAAQAVIPDDQQRLAATRLNLGLLWLESGPPAAEAAFRDAVAVHERLLLAFPDVPEYRAALGTALGALARAQHQRGDPGAARRSLERAIAHHRAALASPRDLEGLARLRVDYGTLAQVLLDAGDHGRLGEAAEQLPALFPDRSDVYLQAAAFLVRCAALAAQDATLSAPRRDEQERSYAGRAVGWLRRAFERGLLTRPTDLDHPDLERLRGRDDFERLRSEMAARRAPVLG